MSSVVDHRPSLVEDEDGWIVPRCTCGWERAAVEEVEEAFEPLMEHAYFVGRIAGRAASGEGHRT